MPKREGDRFRIDIIWLLASVASIGAITSIILSYTGKFTGVSGLFSDLLIFIATVLVSYLITNNNERARFEKEMQRLANFSGRRVDLTTANIEALSNELPEIEDLREMHRLVAFTLKNLAADSGTSLKEIEEMGYVKSDEPTEMARPQINVPRRNEALLEQANKSSGIDTEVSFNCMSCGIVNSTNLREAPGTTKAVECKNCGTDLNVHRLGDGSTKVVNRWSNRSSGVGRSMNVGSRIGARELLSHKVTPRSIEANCPRCGHVVDFRGKYGRVVDDRFCEGCRANVLHNQETGEIFLGPRYEEKLLNRMPDGRFHCDCGREFLPAFKETDVGSVYFVCFSCHTIYDGEDAAKTVVRRPCPTENCETSLTFKIDQERGEGKQICYDCKKRVQYDREEDCVSVIEELTIPIVQRTEWLDSGSLCPKCGNPAGQTTLTNGLGERFHMHWDCKYPFQIID
ncbi:hypothetical protein [Pelagibius sp.]|uniref:hypothetical protein n=1 Tax=Pelagibius sp. TaxID=1931238 RepID=UPI002619C53A|nr:hypothetical protein [Pelagibius sp.]